jgi:acyl carrier protein
MEDRVRKVMAKVFGVAVEKIGKDASPQTIEQWDSLRHMNLVVALEEEFCVRFTDQQIDELLNLPLIVLTLKELGAKA